MDEREEDIIIDEKTGEKQIALFETYAVLTLPEEAVELMVCAKIYHHGEIIQVDRKYSLEDIREAFKRAEEDYFAPDVLWMLKEDKGKEHSHRIRNQTESVKRPL